MRTIKVPVFLSGMILLVAVAALAQNLGTVGSRAAPAVQLAGSYPYGTCYAIGYDDARKLLVIGSGEVLLFLDASNPAHPVKIGEVRLPGQNQRLALEGSLAYVSTYGPNGLAILDIGDLQKPSLLSFYPTIGNPQKVTVSGGIAYFGSANELHIVDVSNPNRPVRKSVFQVGNQGRVVDVLVSNGLAYVTSWYEGLLILDVSDPAAPKLLSTYPDPNVIYVAVSGNTALLGDWNSSEFDTIDISDSAFPKKIGSVTWPETASATGIEIVGRYAYITGEGCNDSCANPWGGGFGVVDISDPSNPRRLSDSLSGNFSGVGPQAISVSGHYAFLAGWVEGAWVIDISNPSMPTVVGRYDTPAIYQDVAVSGNLACIANDGDGFRLLNFSDLSSIVEVGTAATTRNMRSVVADGHHAYVASEGNGLRIIDITGTGSLAEVGALTGTNLPGLAYRLVLSNGYVYVADGDAGLRVVDVHNPTSPTLVGSLATPGFASDVALKENLAFVADGTAGVRIVSVANPSSPLELASFSTATPSCSSPATAVAISGDTLFVAGSSGGDNCIFRVDVSDPTKPQQTGFFNPTQIDGDGNPGIAPVQCLAVEGNQLYVGVAGIEALRVLDIASPGLSQIASHRIPGTPDGITVANGLVYVAADDAGLFIFKFDQAGGLAVDPVSTAPPAPVHGRGPHP